LCLPGATALDKKSRKKFEAEQLARLGAKAETRPRMAASIGHGMAKKQAQRAERALQEGIAGAACGGSAGAALYVQKTAVYVADLLAECVQGLQNVCTLRPASPLPPACPPQPRHRLTNPCAFPPPHHSSRPAAGMVQLKGMGKRKRREKEKERKKERGLMEDGGAFKPGILRVKAPPVSGGGRGGGKGGKRR